MQGESQLPPPDAADAELIERFADTLWMERGLSRNTLVSYQSDLRQVARVDAVCQFLTEILSQNPGLMMGD